MSLTPRQLKRFQITPDEAALAIGAAESGVLLDALITGTLGEVGSDLRVLMQHAMVIAQATYRAAYKNAPRMRSPHHVWHFEAVRAPQAVAGRGRGMIIEHDALCFYCGASLNTLAPRGGMLPREWVEPIERHGEECALRFLMLTSAERAVTRTRSTVQKLLRKKRGIR